MGKKASLVPIGSIVRDVTLSGDEISRLQSPNTELVYWPKTQTVLTSIFWASKNLGRSWFKLDSVVYIGKSPSFLKFDHYRGVFSDPFPFWLPGSSKKASQLLPLIRYSRWVRSSDPKARQTFQSLETLRGKILVCHCLPHHPCHGQVLGDLIEAL